eukprot:13536714-Heterocapsa_arctica.AAC.1
MAARTATRPRLSLVTRRFLKLSTSLSLHKPHGSQKPIGACTPNSLPMALSGSHICGSVVPK